MTIVEFLRARYDEDADYARDAAEEVGDGHWQQRGPRIVTVADRDREVTDYGIVECIWHLIRHDPARVLVEVEAKRRIVDLHARIADLTFIGSEFPPGDDTELAALTLALLALPYAGHADYDQAWRPSVEG